MAQNASGTSQPTLPSLKPSVSQGLWGHLRQMNVPPALRGAGLSAAAVPITPVDKAGTSMRMLLHDTQATLEKFAAHIEKLAGRVDDAKREVGTAHRVFQHGHEKMLEENVALLNRCQTEIQRSVGKPAQVSALDQTQQSLAILDGKVDALDRRADGLDRRVDALHMLNQTQLQTLQAIQDQQTRLLTALSPILPLLQALPMHIENVKAEIKESVRDASESSVQQIAAECMGRGHGRNSPDYPAAARSGVPRKRRKLDDDSLDSSFENAMSAPSGSITSPSPLSPSPADSLACSASSRSRFPSPLPKPNSRSPTLYQSSLDDAPAQRPPEGSSDAAEPLMTTDGSHFDLPSSGPATCAPPTTPVHRHELSPTAGAPAFLELSAVPQRPAAAALVLSSSPPDSAPVPLANCAPPPRITPAAPDAKSDPDIVTSDASHAGTDNRHRQLPAIEDPELSSRPTVGLSASVPPSNAAAPVAQDDATATKPMSLRDRRARGLLSDHDLRNDGKRFIVFDDEDEDELDG